MWLHGGGLIFGSKEEINKEQKEVYVEGFTVVCVDYRLAPETRLKYILADIISAYSWINTKLSTYLPHVNPNNITLIGHSAGSYLSFLLSSYLATYHHHYHHHHQHYHHQHHSPSSSPSGVQQLNSNYSPLINNNQFMMMMMVMNNLTGNVNEDDHLIHQPPPLTNPLLPSSPPSPPPLPRSVVGYYGYGDITAKWYNQPDEYYTSLPSIPPSRIEKFTSSRLQICNSPPSPRKEFYIYCRQRGIWPKRIIRGSDNEDDGGVGSGGSDVGGDGTSSSWEDDMKMFSPVMNLTPNFPPTLLLHGTEDVDVPVSESKKMADALEKVGVFSKLQLFPGCSHMFDVSMWGIPHPSLTSYVIPFINQFAK